MLLVDEPVDASQGPIRLESLSPLDLNVPALARWQRTAGNVVAGDQGESEHLAWSGIRTEENRSTCFALSGAVPGVRRTALALGACGSSLVGGLNMNCPRHPFDGTACTEAFPGSLGWRGFASSRPRLLSYHDLGRNGVCFLVKGELVSAGTCVIRSTYRRVMLRRA